MSSPLAGVVGSRPEWHREIVLRIAFALLPCAVLLLYLRHVLGPMGLRWSMPLTLAFVNALLEVSLARQWLRRRGFVAFSAVYSLFWITIAWHGVHFHSAPRPAALLMNVGEISQVPLPGWSEVPWLVVLAALALGSMARAPSPRGGELRRATLAVAAAFVAVHGAMLIHFPTFKYARQSSFRDLVRTQGIEIAAIIDGILLMHRPDAPKVFHDLRVDAAINPPLPLLLDPVAVDRIVVVQIESLDRDAITARTAPGLLRFRAGASSALVNTHHNSISGSSGADFQLLTGLRPSTAVPVYRLAWDHDASGLPAYAAARGFAFHAYHGYDRHFWNRSPFYDALGVQFETEEQIPRTEYSRWGTADGDLFRYAAGRMRGQGPAVDFIITLSSHETFDLVEPAAHMRGESTMTRYLESIAYVDRTLGAFLQQLPKDRRTLVAMYGDHTSGLFDSGEEIPVPLILGTLTADGSLAPLANRGQPVHDLGSIFELTALHRYLKACLDESSRLRRAPRFGGAVSAH